MTLATSLISHVVRIEENEISSIVIESPRLFRSFVQDLIEGVEHGAGSFILSDGGEKLKLSESVDVLQTFVPFTLNSKAMSAALLKRVERIALMPERRLATAKVMSDLLRYVEELLLDIPHEVECEKGTIGAVLKGLGLRFVEDLEDYPNLVMGYLRLAREFLGIRLSVWINARSYLSDEELMGLLDVASSEKLAVLLVDGVAKKALPHERRLLVDEDLCELSALEDENDII